MLAEHLAPLFNPIRLRGLELPNRIQMAPMTRSFCGDAGVPTPQVAAYYTRRARAGLIVTEGTVVNMAEARGYLGIPGLCTDAQEAGWRAVTEAVHGAGGRISVQLWHCGPLCHSRATGGVLPQAPSSVTPQGAYVDALDPSTHDGHLSYEVPRAMTSADIDRVVGEFAAAARRAVRAGFDAIDIHGAHGYLLSAFMNPDSNRRADRYGGSVANRARLAVEIVAAVRETIPDGMPLEIRLSQHAVNDYEAITWPTPDDYATVLGLLENAGADVIHASANRLGQPGFSGQDGSLATWTRQLCGLKVVAVGGITHSTTIGESFGGTDTAVTDPAEAAAAIDAQECDMVSVGRAMIANPDWMEKVTAGHWQKLQPFAPVMLGELN